MAHSPANVRLLMGSEPVAIVEDGTSLPVNMPAQRFRCTYSVDAGTPVGLHSTELRYRGQFV